MQLKLVTLNIWDIPCWFSLDREARLARLGQYLNKISPDLICLQESFDVKHRDDLYEYLGRDEFTVSKSTTEQDAFFFLNIWIGPAVS